MYYLFQNEKEKELCFFVVVVVVTQNNDLNNIPSTEFSSSSNMLKYLLNILD